MEIIEFGLVMDMGAIKYSNLDNDNRTQASTFKKSVQRNAKTLHYHLESNTKL